MEQEAATPGFLTRDRAVTLGAIAVLAGLSWLILARTSRHPHEIGAAGPATASVAAPPFVAEAHAPAFEETPEDDDVPRFP